jgi:hypothetical protein
MTRGSASSEKALPVTSGGELNWEDAVLLKMNQRRKENEKYTISGDKVSWSSRHSKIESATVNGRGITAANLLAEQSGRETARQMAPETCVAPEKEDLGDPHPIAG